MSQAPCMVLCVCCPLLSAVCFLRFCVLRGAGAGDWCWCFVLVINDWYHCGCGGSFITADSDDTEGGPESTSPVQPKYKYRVSLCASFHS